MKLYVGTALIPDSAYNIQNHLEIEGIYAIKIIPLGVNLCLMEELEEGYIQDFIGEEETWWRSWFTDIRKWKEGIVDEFQDVWLSVYGIPTHVWQ